MESSFPEILETTTHHWKFPEIFGRMKSDINTSNSFKIDITVFSGLFHQDRVLLHTGALLMVPVYRNHLLLEARLTQEKSHGVENARSACASTK